MNLSGQTPAANEWSIDAGEMRLYDPTLSPQEYTGWSLGFRGFHFNRYKPAMPVEWSFRDRFRYGNLINSSSSALINYLSAELTYGTNYLFTPSSAPGLELRLGGALQLFGAYRDQTRNVNNYGAGDVALQGLVTFRIAYHLPIASSRFGMYVSYGLETPLIGCRFAPHYGESYYEIYLRMPDLSQNVAFTSLHNHQALTGDLRIDMIFNNHASLFVTFNHESDYFRFANSLFYNNNLTASLGFALRLAPVDLK